MNFKENVPKSTERDKSARTLLFGNIISSITVVEKYTKNISVFFLAPHKKPIFSRQTSKREI